MFTVYKITNIINQKIYIGQTQSSLEERWKYHCYSAMHNYHPNNYFHNAIRKYGINSFKIEILDSTAQNINDLLELEKKYINQYNTFNKPSIGYNQTSGGDNGVMSDEANARRSKTLTGRKLSEKTKQKIRNTKKNNPWIVTDEYRKKISETSTGRIFSLESIEKRAIKLRGQKRTPEQKERMRQAAIGKVLTEEHKKKIADAGRGRSHVYFEVWNGSTIYGRFCNIKAFCQTHPIMSDVSLKMLLSNKKQAINGYTAKRITKEDFETNIVSN